MQCSKTGGGDPAPAEIKFILNSDMAC